MISNMTTVMNSTSLCNLAGHMTILAATLCQFPDTSNYFYVSKTTKLSKGSPTSQHEFRQIIGTKQVFNKNK